MTTRDRGMTRAAEEKTKSLFLENWSDFCSTEEFFSGTTIFSRDLPSDRKTHRMSDTSVALNFLETLDMTLDFSFEVILEEVVLENIQNLLLSCFVDQVDLSHMIDPGSSEDFPRSLLSDTIDGRKSDSDRFIVWQGVPHQSKHDSVFGIINNKVSRVRYS